MSRILALTALLAAAAALASVVAGPAPALLSEPAAEARAAQPVYPLLERDGGLPDRAAVQRAVRRAVLRERRRNEEAARRERVAEVRRAVARTEAATGAEVRRYRRQLAVLTTRAARPRG